MHIAKLIVPVFLAATATASPVAVGDPGELSQAERGDMVTSAESTRDLTSIVPITRDDAAFAGNDGVSKPLERRLTNGPEFHPARNKASAVARAMVLNGVSVLVTAWFEGTSMAIVQLDSSFPGQGNLIPNMRISDPEAGWSSKPFTAHVPGAIPIDSQTVGRAFDLQEVFKFLWG